MSRILYVSDLDGTLLNHQSTLPEYTIKTINRLIDEGVAFTVATARSWSSAKKVTQGLKLKLPVIIYNGAAMLDPLSDEPMAQLEFSPEEKIFVQKLLKEHGISPLVYSFIEGVEKVSWMPAHENEGMTFYIGSRRGDGRFRSVKEEAALYQGQTFYFTCIGAQAALAPFWNAIKDDVRFTVTFQKELYREEYWLEIMPRKATKAQALLGLKELLGFDRAVAFGDAINDLPLFQAADESYAVSNAVEELKKAANGVIGSNEEGGVAKWLLENARAGDFSLRAYKRDDLEELLTLFHETVNTVALRDYSPEETAAWAPPPEEIDCGAWERDLEESVTLVAEKEGRLVGFGNIYGDTGTFDRLYVHKDFQGMGIATALANALEYRAWQVGRGKMQVFASRTAKGFFQSRGYKVIRANEVKRRGKVLENFLMEKAK